MPANFTISLVLKTVGSRLAFLIFEVVKSFFKFGSVIKVSVGLAGGLGTKSFKYGLMPLGATICSGQRPIEESSADLGGSNQVYTC